MVSLVAMVVRAGAFSMVPCNSRGLALVSSRPARRPSSPRVSMQVQPPETTEGEAAGEQADRGSFMGTKNFVPDGGDWFAKTKDASDRIGNDPLNPMKSSTTLKRANAESRMVGIEKDSNNWYKNQENKRSMFGRTLNPLTGALQDKNEDAEALNPLEDPIFYVILIVGAPVFIMLAAAQACLVPALSLAFGFECTVYYD